MTTVAALIHNGTVYMAADSQTNIYDRPVYTAQKIIRRTSGGVPLLLGVAGDGAMGGLLTYDWTPPYAASDGGLRGWLHEVATSITALCIERNVGLDNGRLHSSVLIGYRGELHHLTHGQAIDPGMNCAAIGRGEEPAMATMLALRDHTNLDPDAILAAAIGYAARLTDGTGGRIHYEHA